MIQNFLLAEVIEIDEKNHVRVKFIEFDDIECKDFIPVMMPAIGEANEATIAPLEAADLVVVAFFDKQMQNPFVLGKIYTSSEFITGKKIRFFEHEIEFLEDKIIIKHKDDTKTTLENGSITFNSVTPFGDITFGNLGLFQFLAGLVCVGNLGLPAPIDPALVTLITNAIAASTEIKLGT